MYRNKQRLEVLWAYFDRKIGKHVENWLPGTFQGYSNGSESETFDRVHVRMDNGWDALETGIGAHPDCVRPLISTS